MTHRLSFTVQVELERVEGKFAGRDEMAEAITEMIENANEGDICGIGADGESDYEITEWIVGDA